MKSILTAALIVSFLSLAPASASAADSAKQSEPTEAPQVDLKKVTCRDFLRASSEEQSELLIFLHGYFSGLKKDPTIDAGKLSVVSDEVVDACIDGPKGILFSVVEKKRK